MSDTTLDALSTAVLSTPIADPSSLDLLPVPVSEREDGTEGDVETDGAAPSSPWHPYLVDQNGRLIRWTEKDDIVLANFSAKIVADFVLDDGVASRREFEIEMHLGGRTIRRRVAADEFDSMRWVTPLFGAGAIVSPGPSLKAQARAAIQYLSGPVPETRVYTHLGWREIDDEWVYLDASRAQLPEALSRYVLGCPGDADDVRASLAMLDVAHDSVTVPLLASVWRSVFGSVDFSIHLHGSTGLGKSESAALAQQHFGAGLDARHLPANWASTANALEQTAFLAKDTVLVIDEFTPSIAKDIQQKAERIFRAEGNSAGRERMNTRLELLPGRPPRGLIVSTGEEIPDGQSLRARLLIIEMEQAVEWDRLTICQKHAAAGRYAAATTGFVAWLAPQLDERQTELHTRARDAAASITASHKRTAAIIGDLYAGFTMFLDYARTVGAIDDAEHSALRSRVWNTLVAVADAQTRVQRDADVGVRFVRLLGELLAASKVRLAKGGDGGSCLDVLPKVGWIDDHGIYLLDDVAYAEVKKLAEDSGEPLTASLRTIRTNLDRKGLLASTGTANEGRQTLKVRRTFDGARVEVLHLHLSTVNLPSDVGDLTTELPTPRSSEAETQWLGVDEAETGQLVKSWS